MHRVDTFGQSLAASAAAAARARALAAPQRAPAPQVGMHAERQPREMLFAVIRPELRSPARSPEVEMQLRCDEVPSPERSPEVEAILDEAVAMNTFPLAPYPEVQALIGIDSWGRYRWMTGYHALYTHDSHAARASERGWVRSQNTTHTHSSIDLLSIYLYHPYP